LEQQKIDRDENKQKRAKSRKIKMYGVLGLDSIIPQDNDAKMLADQAKGSTDHSYGLDMKLFTPEYEKKEREETYN